MKHTTKAQDAAYVLRRLAEATQARRVGERVYSYNGRSETTIAQVDGERVTLANGEQMHISKVRGVQVNS